MTESLLHKLEEKMMMVLSEVETLRKEIKRLNDENAFLKRDKESSRSKLENLVALMDSLTVPESIMHRPESSMGEPILIQG